MDLGHNIAAKALSHVGEAEQPLGSNAGPFVNECLAYVGLPPGNPWCAAFACKEVGDSIAEMGISADAPCSGSSGALVAWAKEHGTIVDCPQAGDLGEVIGDSPTGYVHTVVCYTNADEIETIEGNEGDKVAKRTRTLDECTWLRPYVIHAPND